MKNPSYSKAVFAAIILLFSQNSYAQSGKTFAEKRSAEYQRQRELGIAAQNPARPIAYNYETLKIPAHSLSRENFIKSETKYYQSLKATAQEKKYSLDNYGIKPHSDDILQKYDCKRLNRFAVGFVLVADNKNVGVSSLYDCKNFAVKIIEADKSGELKGKQKIRYFPIKETATFDYGKGYGSAAFFRLDNDEYMSNLMWASEDNNKSVRIEIFISDNKDYAAINRDFIDIMKKLVATY